MSQIFLIADTHFGHKNICKFEPEHRPFGSVEEHDEELVKRWNSVVKPTDTVWHLGDVLFGVKSFDLLPRLNGTKKLVMGNHDHYSMHLYMDHFTRVAGSAEVAGYVLTHMPVHNSQSTRYKGNIHGHLHSNMLDSDFHINVSAEQVNLTPISLEVAISRQRKSGD